MLDLHERQTVRTWRDLQQFGIITLTGESCGLGMRILCDLTPAGVKLLESFWGNQVTIKLGSNWNSSDGQIASVMLTNSVWAELAAFALAQCNEIVIDVHHWEEGWSACFVCGCTKEEWEEHRDSIWKFYAGDVRVYTGSTKTRNTHYMSGRTV